MIENFMDFCVSKVLMPSMILVVLVLVFIGIPVMSYHNYVHRNDPTFELIKSDWVCTNTHLSVTYISNGSVMTPIENKKCIQWTAKSE